VVDPNADCEIVLTDYDSVQRRLDLEQLFMDSELAEILPKPLGLSETLLGRCQEGLSGIEQFEHSALVIEEIEDNSANRSLNLHGWKPQSIRVFLFAYQPIGDVIAVTASLLDRMAGRQPVTRMIEEDTG